MNRVSNLYKRKSENSSSIHIKADTRLRIGSIAEWTSLDQKYFISFEIYFDPSLVCNPLVLWIVGFSPSSFEYRADMRNLMEGQYGWT